MKFVKFKNLILTVTLTAGVFAMPFFSGQRKLNILYLHTAVKSLQRSGSGKRHGSVKKLTRQTLTRFQSS